MENIKLFVVDKLRRFYGFLVFVLALILISSSVRSVSRIGRAGEKLREVEERIRKLERENKDLEERLENVKSDEYVEQQLRDKLGLAKEGEVVVVLPEEDVIREFAPKMESEEDFLPESNWAKWVRLFGF
jgi:cell division protein FtsB